MTIEDLTFKLLKIKWAYQERAMIRRGVEWLVWQAAYLLPRRVALITFVRVYAETMEAPGPDYERVYRCWEANDLKERQEASKRRAALVEGTLLETTSDQQDAPSDLEIRTRILFTAADLASEDLNWILKQKINEARQSMIAKSIEEIERRGRVVEYVINTSERSSDNVLQ